MSDKVNLFFFPEYQEGFDEDETREKLAKTLGVDEEKVETWFESTKPTIIRLYPLNGGWTFLNTINYSIPTTVS